MPCETHLEVRVTLVRQTVGEDRVATPVQRLSRRVVVPQQGEHHPTFTLATINEKGY